MTRIYTRCTLIRRCEISFLSFALRNIISRTFRRETFENFERTWRSIKRSFVMYICYLIYLAYMPTDLSLLGCLIDLYLFPSDLLTRKIKRNLHFNRWQIFLHSTQQCLVLSYHDSLFCSTCMLDLEVDDNFNKHAGVYTDWSDIYSCTHTHAFLH